MNLSDYKYTYDLHVHTSPVSPCSEIDPKRVIDLYSALGFSGIALTNHFNLFNAFSNYNSKNEAVKYYLNDYFEAKKYGEEVGINVILGLEIRFPENANEYLVYGIDEDDVFSAYDYLSGDYKTFYKEFKNERNVILQAHPYRPMCTIEKPDILDGIEVFNMHPHHNSRIALAARTAEENPQFIITAGTDFHHCGHQGLGATCFKNEIEDSFALCNALKARDYIFDISSNKIVPYQR